MLPNTAAQPGPTSIRRWIRLDRGSAGPGSVIRLCCIWHASPSADARPGKVPDNWLRLARRLAESGGSGEVAASLRKIEIVRDRLEVADPVVCHGDFHPLNVLVAPGGSALHVIDWTNVGVGDPARRHHVDTAVVRGNHGRPAGRGARAAAATRETGPGTTILRRH